MRAGDDKSKKKKDSREKNNYVIKVKHNTNHDDWCEIEMSKNKLTKAETEPEEVAVINTAKAAAAAGDWSFMVVIKI